MKPHKLKIWRSKGADQNQLAADDEAEGEWEDCAIVVECIKWFDDYILFAVICEHEDGTDTTEWQMKLPILGAVNNQRYAQLTDAMHNIARTIASNAGVGLRITRNRQRQW